MKKSILFLLIACFMLMGFQPDGFAKKQKLTKEQKRAAKLAKKEKVIEKHVGTRTNWKPEAFKHLRKGMTCSQVSQIFKRLNCGGSSSFKIAPGGLGTISQYKFYFYRGRLSRATLIFGVRLLDSKVFNTALSRVVQKKWGTIADTANVQWKNGNFETVRLKFNKNHWELDVQLPSVDPGDVNLQLLDEANLRTNLEAFFGGRSNCVPEFFTRYKYHMSWQELKERHRDMNYDPSKSVNYSYASISNHPLIAGLKFRIDSGLLESVEAIFHWQIPRDIFKQVSFEVMRGKYGVGIKDEQLVKDRVSVYTPAKEFVYREWKTNRWAVRMRLPKQGHVIPVTAAKAKTRTPRLQSTSCKIMGGWKLVAAKQGGKTASMKDGMERQIEFTAGQMMLMKENGKTVLKNYYKKNGSGLYFTAVKGGKAVKKFATLVSCSTNQLVLVIEGQSPQMIFQRQ